MMRLEVKDRNGKVGIRGKRRIIGKWGQNKWRRGEK